ncbi:calcium-activated chloride channel regulator 2-like [Ptychodera flava]|uniref:calcium-activated chloride channel regulator 2-like n=1 Tax=Ptychodera flava TaxID=63121 RepID=UPI00396A417D
MVIIYADLNQGHSPVLNAEVIATIERPRPHSNVELYLLDRGLGADVTKDDGVYSAYFIDFVDATCTTACRYNIKVAANDTDGRAESRFTGAGLGAMPRNYSVIPEKKEGTPVGAFNRVASGGVIQVDDGVTYVDWSDPDDDPFPPSRISDLQVIATSVDNATVTLTWTATGDNFDIGTASVSDLRYDTQFENLAYRFDNCSQLSNDILTEGNLTDPLPSGQREVVTVRLPYSGVGITYYFSIRAVDGVGNTGQPSFIAQTTIVYAAPDETTTEIPPSTQPVVTTEAYIEIISSGLKSWEIFLIVVATCVGLAVVAAGILIYYKKVKGHAKVSDKSIINDAVSNDIEMNQTNIGKPKVYLTK